VRVNHFLKIFDARRNFLDHSESTNCAHANLAPWRFLTFDHATNPPTRQLSR
jgi:hypothetical protein